MPLSNNPPPDAMRSYTHISSETPDGWSPFDPDPLGAMIEALAWIQNPQRMTPDILEYRKHHFNQLTAMLRRAIAKERAKQMQRAA